MIFDVINSGSKGNATLVFSNNTIILIEMGICTSTLVEELDKFNHKLEDIDAVFITHNHVDHIRGIKAFSPKKIYALEGTMPGSLSNVIEANKKINIKELTVFAFPTSHDAINPCGFCISDESSTLVYMTDTGVYLSENTELIKNPDYLIIESNHDIPMLMHTNRPMELIQRIMSDHGHLCNEDSAFAACEIIGNNTKEIVLAHLSEEANTPELALKAYKKVFLYKNIDIKKFKIRCANQRIPLIGGDYEN